MWGGLVERVLMLEIEHQGRLYSGAVVVREVTHGKGGAVEPGGHGSPLFTLKIEFVELESGQRGQYLHLVPLDHRQGDESGMARVHLQSGQVVLTRTKEPVEGAGAQEALVSLQADTGSTIEHDHERGPLEVAEELF